jgi:hypothetical protein
MGPSPYQSHPIDRPSVTEVLPDPQRRFLVVSGTRSRTGKEWTLVLEAQDDYWISRRELAGTFPPEASVSGYLFDRQGYPDPVGLLRRMNELVRGEYYRILQEKMAGDRERNELTSELTRLQARIDALRAELRRKSRRLTRPALRRSRASSPRRRRPT